ncbi:MAG: head completion/stabilization protein [Novosphingobium sp.]
MSFVALPASPVSPDNAVVPGDGWYPDIDVNAMRDALRITDQVTHARIVGAIEGGLLTVEGELAFWRATQESEGFAALDEIEPDRMIGGEHRLTLLYTRAVRFHAAAELAELHRDLSATTDGATRAEPQLLTAEDYRKHATAAIRDILGTPRVTVELI